MWRNNNHNNDIALTLWWRYNFAMCRFGRKDIVPIAADEEIFLETINSGHHYHYAKTASWHRCGGYFYFITETSHVFHNPFEFQPTRICHFLSFANMDSVTYINPFANSPVSGTILPVPLLVAYPGTVIWTDIATLIKQGNVCRDCTDVWYNAIPL